jgi:hypothetical protein
MNSEFVAQIEHPESRYLQETQQSAYENVRDRLSEHHMTDVPERVLEKLTYTYYHDWEQNDPSYFFLLADPGVPGEHVVFEASAYADLAAEAYREKVHIDQRFGARWLAKKRYTDFTSEFIQRCQEHGLVDVDESWWQYLLSGSFFDDFYMTDVVKYREGSPKAAALDASVRIGLIEELEYINPDLIFAFGKRAWDAIQTHLQAEPVSNRNGSSSITDAHGTLHQATGEEEIAILPCGHMSPQFRGAQISHEEYMDRIESGIREFCKN